MRSISTHGLRNNTLDIARRLQNGVRRFGLDVRRIRGSHGEYADVVPKATYAPWNTNRAFRRIYDQVTEHTLVDVFRCYELWSLTHEVSDVPGAIIEIGVWRGGSGAVLATAARHAGIDQPVYLCDTFTGVPKAGARDPVYRGGEHADTSAVIVHALLSRLAIDNVRIVPGVFPDQTASSIPARTFRLVHVDVDTYQSAKDCVAYLWPLLSPGGVLIFDDYGFDGLRGIREYVDELSEMPDRLFIHNLNGHGLIIKLR